MGEVCPGGSSWRVEQQRTYTYSWLHRNIASATHLQGEGERAEEQFLRALEIEPLWSDIAWVKANTRWPPALEDAFARFLAIQGSS